MSDPKRDVQTVTPDGETIGKLPDGARLRNLKTHVDDRGALWELFDPRWGSDEMPLTYAYVFEVRPSKIKAWNVHREHEDRYAMLYGELVVVLYDDRGESSTKGLVSEVFMSEYHRSALSIPIGVWHGVHNIGEKTATVVNFPTALYNHENPDKFRLPADSSEIPYTFKTSLGW